MKSQTQYTYTKQPVKQSTQLLCVKCIYVHLG